MVASSRFTIPTIDDEREQIMRGVIDAQKARIRELQDERDSFTAMHLYDLVIVACISGCVCFCAGMALVACW